MPREVNRAKTYHQQMVERFMELAGQPCPGLPTLPDRATRLLRARLILEEALETLAALGFTAVHRDGEPMTAKAPHEAGAHAGNVRLVEGPADLCDIADGCADLSVVTVGTLSACGIADAGLLTTVDINNLDKFGAGHRIDAGGKVIKPDGHRPPDIARTLRGQGWCGDGKEAT